VISDEELKETGHFDPDSKLYDIDENLLFFRTKDQPKLPKMSHFYHEKWHEEMFIANPGGIGSNCWSVHGNYTESGSPYLSCDPHLNKQLQSMWYLAGLTWKSDSKQGNEPDDNELFIVGGTVVGIPMFSYGRSSGYSWGPTALNPDNSDLFVERVEGNKYFFDNQWYEFREEKEVFKVRGGADYHFTQRYTHNGVMLFKPSKDDIGFSIWFPLEFLNQNNDLDYSLRWVYFEDIGPNRVFTNSKELFNNKPSLEGIKKFMEAQTFFPLNMNFVTSTGDIGYHMTGIFPKRKYKVAQGVYPKKGWLKEN